MARFIEAKDDYASYIYKWEGARLFLFDSSNDTGYTEVNRLEEVTLDRALQIIEEQERKILAVYDGIRVLWF